MSGDDVQQNDSPLIDSGAWKKSLPPTMWSCIERAQGGDQAAITDLARRYGTPVFCYFRQHGMNPEAAKDLTQDLFLKLTRGQLFAKLRPRVYRFRSFLKRALSNMFIDAIRRAQVDIRWPEGGLACLDRVMEGAAQLEPAEGETPEEAFDREYGHTLLSAVIVRVGAECERDGLGVHFEIFAAKHLENPPLGWVEIGPKYGLSADAVRNRAKTVQDRFRKALEEEIRTPDMSDAEFAEEIADLIRAFGRAQRRRW
ncbi:MAG: sigma-70 family RNA polymerase sigma factor [Phycisphaerae bacterium]|nr:sigma-70 family RNA polymerase sigma factor [Phycisphaerae bacterium]